jgi:hypothetical protein
MLARMILVQGITNNEHICTWDTPSWIQEHVTQTHDTLKLGTCNRYTRETLTRDTSTCDTRARDIRSYASCASDTRSGDLR